MDLNNVLASIEINGKFEILEIEPSKTENQFLRLNPETYYLIDPISNQEFNSLTESNKFIIMYPQTSIIPLTKTTDNIGCWDMWGFTDVETTVFGKYVTKKGVQMEIY
jgi:hypothetical protein